MTHRSVKHALVDHLAAGLPGYGYPATTDKPDQNTPAGTVWVAPADAMPADPARWPFAIVRTTRMPSSQETGDPLVIRCTYRCEITVGVRSDLADPDDSRLATTDNRDDLLTAVRNTLHWSRKLTAGIRVQTRGWTEDTAPSVWEKTGQAIALGTAQFEVTATEQIPAPTGSAAVTITDADATAHERPFDTPTLP